MGKFPRSREFPGHHGTRRASAAVIFKMSLFCLLIAGLCCIDMEPKEFFSYFMLVEMSYHAEDLLTTSDCRQALLLHL